MGARRQERGAFVTGVSGGFQRGQRGPADEVKHRLVVFDASAVVHLHGGGDDAGLPRRAFRRFFGVVFPILAVFLVRV